MTRQVCGFSYIYNETICRSFRSLGVTMVLWLGREIVASMIGEMGP